MNNLPELKLVPPAEDEQEASQTPQSDNTPRLADAPIRKFANSQMRPSANSQMRPFSPPELRVLSAAEKADREVNEILIRRLMRALLANDRKAA